MNKTDTPLSSRHSNYGKYRQATRWLQHLFGVLRWEKCWILREGHLHQPCRSREELLEEETSKLAPEEWGEMNPGQRLGVGLRNQEREYIRWRRQRGQSLRGTKQMSGEGEVILAGGRTEEWMLKRQTRSKSPNSLSAALGRETLSFRQLGANEGFHWGWDDQKRVVGGSLCLQCGSWTGKAGEQRQADGIKHQHKN